MANSNRTLRKSLFIGVSAVVLSTLGIQASDVMRSIDGGMAALVGSSGPCGPHAVRVLYGTHAVCMDQFEASAASACPHAAPQSELETAANLQAGQCAAASAPEVAPWRFVTLAQAQQLCARAGKRLPTNEEWYKVAASLGDQTGCVTDRGAAGPLPTGMASCATESGVHDLVGNVWEWMDETASNGVYDARTLPASGYVRAVDAAGVVVETGLAPDAGYGEDYAWVHEQGVRGFIRGGFYGSGDDAGIFTQNIAVPTNFNTAGVGFRCVQDLSVS